MTARTAGGWVYNMLDAYTSRGLKAMLLSSSFSFNPDVHWYRSTVTGEVSGTGYPSGGVEVTGVNVVTDTASDRVSITADNVIFPTMNVLGIAQVVVYFDTGNSATDEILSVHTFTPVDVQNTTFTYTFPGNRLGSFGY